MSNGKNGFPMIFCGKKICKVEDPVVGRHIKVLTRRGGEITGVCREVKETDNQFHYLIESGNLYMSLGEGTRERISAS